MEPIPRDYGARCRFDAYCKTVLHHEAINYLRELQRRCKRETSFDALSQSEMDKLCSVDSYPSEHNVFSAYGYDLLIDNELVSDAFAELPMPSKVF